MRNVNLYGGDVPYKIFTISNPKVNVPTQVLTQQKQVLNIFILGADNIETNEKEVNNGEISEIAF